MCNPHCVSYVVACGHYTIWAGSKLEEGEACPESTTRKIKRLGSTIEERTPCDAFIRLADSHRPADPWGGWTFAVSDGREISITVHSSGHCDEWLEAHYSVVRQTAVTNTSQAKSTSPGKDNPSTSKTVETRRASGANATAIGQVNALKPTPTQHTDAAGPGGPKGKLATGLRKLWRVVCCLS